MDDASGQILFRKNITRHQSQTVTYEVYAGDSPAPLSPSNATPANHIQGSAVARTQFTLVSEMPAFDNLGWITDNATCTTTGNNVDAGLDIDGIDGIDAAGRPTGSTGASPGCRNFIFSYTPPPGGTEAPTGSAYRMGVVTDVFFCANRYHDRLYSLGFTAQARNFQNDNFGRGGSGGDFVRAQVQDSSGTNNANFSPTSDGTSPRMQMYIFDGPTPDRDGALDHEVVLHELTHGLSNRLIGNALGLNFNQGGGMGEGWSDFYALSLLSDPADDPNGVYAAGAYATFELWDPGFHDSYFYGIRRFPYTTNMSLNPITFADIDPLQVNLSNGTFPPGPPAFLGGANEVHNVGEIWTALLWEGRANFIARLGGAAGNNRMLQVVTDGMKLTPPEPTFVQARNAIIQAACAGFGGADEIDLRRGFAKRGLGYSAVAPAFNSTTLQGVVEAFDLPFINGTPSFSDTAGGNGNGFIDPGETIALTIPAINNFDCAGLTAVAGTLSTSTPGITITQNSSNYGPVAAGASVNGTSYQFQVDPSVACGTVITFNLTSAEGVSSTHTIKLTVGQSALGAPATFTYSGPPVAIPDNNPAGAIATLTVSGVPTVGDINLNLTNITHTWVGDLVVQLIAPDGTGITMINRIPNGSGSNGNDNFTNTILDDEAVSLIQAQTGVGTNASFKPGNPLSGFDGKTGNGTWTLKVIDAATFDTGTITSWSLTITPVTFACSAPPSKPTVTITATDPNASETGPDTGTFEVSRVGSTDSALTVNYTVSGTATPGSDYFDLSANVVIPTGQSSAQIVVTPIDDADIGEGNETVIVTLTANAVYTIGSPSSATVTITDNDLPTVTILATDNTATELGATTGTFTVSRTGLTTASLTVLYSVSGTATPGSDYTTLSGSVVIPTGQSSATIMVTPIDDADIGEGDETVIATLTLNAAYTVGAQSSATVTITDNDLPDTTPDPFSFTAQTGVALNTVVTSNTITVSGINAAAPISITGGTYSVNGGAFTAVSGTVNNANTVAVRQTSSGSFSTLTTATLTIGGISGAFNVTTQAAPVDTTRIFQDDMESGPGGWFPESRWARTTETAHSSSHSWTDSPAGKYRNNAYNSLWSPVLSFSGFSSVFLTFWHRFDLEDNFDFGNVLVGDGVFWRMASFTGTNDTWTKVTLDLSAFAGQPQVYVVFNLTSDKTVVRNGWYIDDVLVTGTRLGPGLPDIHVGAPFVVLSGPIGDANITVQNAGTATLNVSATSIVGLDASLFTITGGGGAFSLEPAESRIVTVRFVPTTNGIKDASLRLVSDDPDENPKDVRLVGATGLYINVTTPIGGESWPIGSNQTIRWSSAIVGKKVKIQLSRNGGASWTTLFASTPTYGLKNWKVTKAASTQGRIRVCSVYDPSICDTSDANFTIQ